MILGRVAPLLFLALTGCVAAPSQNGGVASSDIENESVAGQEAQQPPAEWEKYQDHTPGIPLPMPPAVIEGRFEQGGWIRGVVPEGTETVTVDGEPLDFDDGTGAFFLGLDRDASTKVALVFRGNNTGRIQEVEIAPRAWDIERVNVPKGTGGGGEDWWAKREPEWLAIRDARAKETGAEGWKQDFVWPVTGRISGRFGRQRIYQGEPGSYHSGIDIAPGNGVPFVAPADGMVVLARTGFSLEGGIIIVDHGAGLNSAFLHLSRLAVEEGDTVRQGQLLGNVGASGRASGPHLHWSLMWQDKRLDPLLFLPPMP